MPPPKKIDLIPSEVKDRLGAALEARGFGGIVEVTEDLNFWLVDAGLEIRIGKTAVGEYSKLLKEQREAFSIAETLLSEMDLSAESDLHRVLMQMIATSMMQFMKSVQETEDGQLDPKSILSLSKALKDLMASSGIREKLLEDERRRAREAERAEQAARVQQAIDDGDTTEEVGAEALRILFGA